MILYIILAAGFEIGEIKLICPNCHIEQYCGCDTCRKEKLKNDPDFDQSHFQVYCDNTDLIACGNCDLKLTIDQWFNLDIKENLEKVF